MRRSRSLQKAKSMSTLRRLNPYFSRTPWNDGCHKSLSAVSPRKHSLMWEAKRLNRSLQS